MKMRKKFGKLTTAFSLAGLAMGFNLLGIQAIELFFNRAIVLVLDH